MKGAILRALLPSRCSLCRERHRHMDAHMWMDHGYEGVPS